MPKKTQPAPRLHMQQFRILVAWQPQSSGDEALEVAAWLARTADVTVQCVTTFLRPWPSPAMSKLGSKHKKWFKKETERYTKAVSAKLNDVGIDRAQWANPVAVIADGTSESVMLTQAAHDFGADMILLGSKAAAPKGRFLPGTTADSMLHSSPRPLLLAPRSPKLAKRGITRVNVAFIGQDTDESATTTAAELAAAWGVPLRILALSPDGFGAPPVSESIKPSTDLSHEWRENALAILDRLRSSAHAAFPHIDITCEVGSGNGWHGALDVLKWKKGDLLCFGSSPLGAFERVFIGSQTSEILPHVQVPVLMIPTRGKEQ
ncbi:MAG: universal stress protein [Corynebacterium sp.]|uniref:universal stress protein n=1 Tax=Corynebacterium sp. TaxID=1720 RepID=UPI0026DCD0E4|nr:universal stress protein [Corynebacterium sp.]MDO5098777.1 universal stress protein [Corynebacterium sp.]